MRFDLEMRRLVYFRTRVEMGGTSIYVISLMRVTSITVCVQRRLDWPPQVELHSPIILFYGHMEALTEIEKLSRMRMRYSDHGRTSFLRP